MSWDAMLRDNELRRRRALAKLTKTQLIDRLIEAEQLRDSCLCGNPYCESHK